jgi:hypothetical protein
MRIDYKRRIVIFYTASVWNIYKLKILHDKAVIIEQKIVIQTFIIR